jgi:uncharacterized membrane protein required for colicin V production
VNIVLGVRRGLFGSLYGLVGRVLALAGAFIVARVLAPIVSRFIVTPIVGSVFEKQAALSHVSGLQDSVTDAAANMAESVAFLLLLLLGCIVFGWLVVIAAKSLHFIAHLTPLGALDSLAGGVIGLATGLVLVVLVLFGINWFSPITYTSLGWLSPERVSNTVLLAAILRLLPIA